MKRIVLAGAVAGAAVGLLLLAASDPSDSSTNDAYRSGQRVGYLVRYAALGAAAAALAVLVLRPREGTSNGMLALYLGGLAVVLSLAILPPLLDEESASEHRRAEAVRSGDERAEFRAGAIDGCVEGVRNRFGSQVEQARLDIDAYCECLIDRLMARAANRGESLQAVGAQLQGVNQPSWALRAADRCGRRAVGA